MVEARQHGIDAVLHRFRVHEHIANTPPKGEMNTDAKPRHEASLEMCDYSASPKKVKGPSPVEHSATEQRRRFLDERTAQIRTATTQPMDLAMQSKVSLV